VPAAFDARGEPGSAAAPKAGRLDDVNELLGRLFRQDIVQSEVTVAGDIGVDCFNVDVAAIAERDPDLFLKKGDIVYNRHVFTLDMIIERVFLDNLAADKMAFNDFPYFLGRHFRIIGPVRVHINNRADRRTYPCSRA
jgi:hypothetical protein